MESPEHTTDKLAQELESKQRYLRENEVKNYKDRIEIAEALQTLRKAGFPKPEHVSWGDWLGTKKLTDRHELIALYVVSGINQTTIASQLGYTNARLSIIMNSARMRARVLELRQQYYGNTVQGRFNAMASKAVNVVDEILDSPSVKPAVKLKAANEALNRAIGKPKETLEVRSTSAKDIFDYLDRKRQEQKVLDEKRASAQAEEQFSPQTREVEAPTDVTLSPTVLEDPFLAEQDKALDAWIGKELKKFSKGD